MSPRTPFELIELVRRDPAETSTHGSRPEHAARRRPRVWEPRRVHHLSSRQHSSLQRRLLVWFHDLDYTHCCVLTLNRFSMSFTPFILEFQPLELWHSALISNLLKWDLLFVAP